MAWSVVHGPAAGGQTRGPRGITWTSGDWNEASCSYINQKVWVGYLNGGNGQFAPRRPDRRRRAHAASALLATAAATPPTAARSTRSSGRGSPACAAS
jgi:hypothetical protein